MKHLKLHFMFFLGILRAIPALGETQNSVGLTAPYLFNGQSGSFVTSQVSGNASVASGTITKSYSGVSSFVISSATGRYIGKAGTTVYGFEFGPMYLMRSILTTNFFTIVNSAKLCPSAGTYNWLGLRYRPYNAARNSMNAGATNFTAGGTLTYDENAANDFTGSTIFNLAGPTLTTSADYNLNGFNGATCANGSMRVQTSGTLVPFDTFGTFYFADNSFSYLSTGGDPIMRIGVKQETLTGPKMTALTGSVFSGLYSSYDSLNAQTQYNVYLYPDGAGTTFTIYRINSLSDPTQKTLLGVLACTSTNSPDAGFCSGTLNLDGVAGTGKAVCMLSTQTVGKSLVCSAQRPDDIRAAVSIIANIPVKSVLAISAPNTVASVAPGGSVNFSVTLTNLSGRKIQSIAVPANPALRLSAPFSAPSVFTGAGGTCNASLDAYSSCNVTVTYAPTVVGSTSQIFRASYDDGYFGTVNATLGVAGTSGLVSIAVTPALGSAPQGATVQYTATATYSNGSTQNVTSIVNWSSLNSAIVSTSAQGTASYIGTGSTTIQAQLAGISGSQAATISGGSTIEVLGQPDAESLLAAATGLNAPRGMIFLNGRLFLADTFNNRILMWDAIPSSNSTPPDRVLGQPDFSTTGANYDGVTSHSMYQPFIMASDGTRLVVSDTYNHRILIWNTIPTTSFQDADLVLGQPNMTSSTANNGGLSASSINYPLGVALSSSGKLMAADFGNHRVLIWNTFPTSNGQAANVVLGQTNMTSGTLNSGGISASSLYYPYGCSTDGTRMYVADSYNNRVLIWNTIPTVNKTNANVVLGQPNFTSNTANNGGRSASTMSFPMQVHSSGTKLMVSDQTNNRVLIWNTIPSANGQAASVVLGQPNMTSGTTNNGGISATSLSTTYGVYMDSSRAMVADMGNNRVMVWNSIPTANAQAADLVLGQSTFTTNGVNGLGTSSGDSLYQPQSIDSNGTVSVVADTGNNRVLIWNSKPTVDGQAADVVVGQPDMTSNTANNGGISASRLSAPRVARIIGTKLVVADTGNNRVLIWNTIPTSNGQAANVVVGQANMTSNTANNGGRTAARLSSPYDIASNGTVLFIADYSNHRILKFNTIPVANGASANIVLGQANMTAATVNSGGLSASSLNFPASLVVVGTKLIAGDYSNYRVLIWNTIPTANTQASNVVIGQANMTTATYNSGGVSSRSLTYPLGVYSNGTQLFVADNGNNRVLGWNTIPVANYTAASFVLGQPSFAAVTANNGGLSATSLSAPRGVFVDSTNAWVADTNNSRILISPIRAQLGISDSPNYDFGSLLLNGSLSKTFVITNSGSGSATSVGAGSPALSSPFSFVGGAYPGTGGTCTTTIVSQSTCTIVVRFNPTVEAADFQDVVRISYADGFQNQVAVVGVTGRAILQATLTFTNGATYNMGTVRSGSSVDRTLTVSNASGVTASYLKQSSAAIASPFTFKGGTYPGAGGTCGSSVPTGSTCTLVLTFAPTAVTSYSQTLSVDYYDGVDSNAVTIGLQGTGN